MKNIRTTEELVFRILAEHPETRSSDNRLYIKVIEYIDTSLLYKPVVDILINRKAYKIPPYESVGRVRRKLQSQFPHLSSNRTVAERRAENEEFMKEYAREIY